MSHFFTDWPIDYRQFVSRHGILVENRSSHRKAEVCRISVQTGQLIIVNLCHVTAYKLNLSRVYKSTDCVMTNSRCMSHFFTDRPIDHGASTSRFTSRLNVY